LIWERFAGIKNYVEPFAGSLAVLLDGPTDLIRTVNDKDGYIANFWRAIQADPDGMAQYADWPVNENDIHARHIWLVNQTDLVSKLEGDPDYYDAKIAGWWVWGISCWIGGGWCSGIGPWRSVDGMLTKDGSGHGVRRQRCSSVGAGAGMGIHRQLPDVAPGQGVHRIRPLLGGHGGGAMVTKSGSGSRPIAPRPRNHREISLKSKVIKRIAAIICAIMVQIYLLFARRCKEEGGCCTW